jgi:hypothetical protein
VAVVKVTILPSDLDRSKDFIHTTVLIFVWDALEANVVIIAGCIPTLMPIFDLLRGRRPDHYSPSGQTSGGVQFSKRRTQGSSSWNITRRAPNSVPKDSRTMSSSHMTDSEEGWYGHPPVAHRDDSRRPGDAFYCP